MPVPDFLIGEKINQAGLEDIYRKLETGDRLSREDGVRLFEHPDFNTVGMLANLVREKKHGNVTYFVKNQNINYSNYCVLNCSFCGFKRKPGQEGGYTFQIDEIVKKVATEARFGVHELHMVGGLHPDMPYSWYIDLLRQIKQSNPEVYIKAFTMIEIDHLARLSGKTHHQVLSELKEAGLDCMPGGGAEIFAPRVRTKLCPEKETGAEWLQIAKTAHQLGIRTNATMLYGHIENFEDRVDHMLDLRQLQDETGGFFAFIPLPYQPNTPGFSGDWTSGIDNLRTLAVARLLLDNFDHIKCFWIMNSSQIAQLSMYYGVDDIDGTVTNYTITKTAGINDSVSMTQNQIIKLIRDAGRDPVERNAMYHVVQTF
ncbi:MAG: aminofutalosine synthase MqnE [Bacteroidetes bacterium]|nr:aminofutalosine synthase MqnE [Bacteroidota bacterium]